MEEFKKTSRYYEVAVEILQETEDKKGNIRIKKVSEHHLVDASNPTEVEAKVKEMMSGEMYEWSIKAIKVSSIDVVYS